MKSRCELMSALDGNKIPVVTRGEETYRFGSLYDGRYAASRWVFYHVNDEIENVILFGMGDCQIVHALLEKIPGQVFVYEPDDEIYKKVKTVPVYKKLQNPSANII